MFTGRRQFSMSWRLQCLNRTVYCPSLLQELKVFRDPKQVAEMANRKKGNTPCASLLALTPSERTHTEMHIKKFSPTKLWLFCTLFLAATLCSSGAQGAETVILPPTRRALNCVRRGKLSRTVLLWRCLTLPRQLSAATSALRCRRARNRASGPFITKFSLHIAPQTAQFTLIPVRAPPRDYPKIHLVRRFPGLGATARQSARR
jgi:hypothetical protein